MFANACTLARNFTRPVVTSICDVNGNVSSGIGAFVVLNEEGWILTAWHVIEALTALRSGAAAYADQVAKRKAIEADADMQPSRRKRELQKLPFTPGMVRSFSPWWAWDGVSLEGYTAIPEVDLAVGKLRGFDPDSVRVYPTLKDPTAEPWPGTSLCRLGFPFHEITPIYNEVFGTFELPAGSVPPPFFPIEGILTRNVMVGNAPAGFPLVLVETSSPGLRGQSGGPIFDTAGVIWGIQTATQHLPLGFEAKMKVNGREHVEHQFLNSGLGAHFRTIVGFLDQLGVKYTVAP